MYIVEGDELSLDHLPSNENDDIVVTDKNVMIIQKRDFEEADASTVVATLESAISDLSTMLDTQKSARAAILSKDKVQCRVMLKEMIDNRTKMESRYGKMHVLAIESAIPSTDPIIALEQEVNKTDPSKGFFSRIISSIVEAFQWLWKKIASLFSSDSAKSEELVTKSKEKAEHLRILERRASEAGLVFPDLIHLSSQQNSFNHTVAEKASNEQPVTLGSRSLMDNFGFLAEDVKADMAIRNLEETLRHAEKIHYGLVKACTIFQEVVRKTKEYNHLENIEDTKIAADMNSMFRELESIMASFPNSSRRDLISKEIIDDQIVTKPGTEKAVSVFMKGAQLFAWVAEFPISKGSSETIGIPAAKFIQPEERVSANSIEALNSAQAKRICDLMESITKNVTASQKEAASAAEGNSRRMSDLDQALTSFQGKGSVDRDALSRLVAMVSLSGRGINRVTLSLASSEEALNHSCKAYAEYISISVRQAEEALKPRVAPPSSR